MDKLTSRKFWICVAAFLGSIATSISGLCTDNQTIVIIGVIAGILSAAIYAACEAYIDAKAVVAEDSHDIVKAIVLHNYGLDDNEPTNDEDTVENDG